VTHKKKKKNERTATVSRKMIVEKKVERAYQYSSSRPVDL
jgi:hypothetical protein